MIKAVSISLAIIIAGFVAMIFLLVLIDLIKSYPMFFIGVVFTVVTFILLLFEYTPQYKDELLVDIDGLDYIMYMQGVEGEETRRRIIRTFKDSLTK